MNTKETSAWFVLAKQLSQNKMKYQLGRLKTFIALNQDYFRRKTYLSHFKVVYFPS